MHIKYAYQKCRFNVHQVSTTYVNIYKPKYVKKKEQQHNKVVHAIDTQHSNSKTASVYSTNNKCVLSRKNTFLSSSIQQVCAAEVQSNWCSAGGAAADAGAAAGAAQVQQQVHQQQQQLVQHTCCKCAKAGVVQLV
jgi:hypothetical protein